jgi:probable HAF family extracellular repeat protein
VGSGTYTFQVIANASGIYGAVEGTLIFSNSPVSAPVGPGSITTAEISNAVVQVTPTTVTAGPGTSALLQVAVTNVGPVADTFILSAGGPSLPAKFDNPTPTISPGATFTANLSLTVALGTAPQSIPVTVQASGKTGHGTGQGQATLKVVANGLTLTLNPQIAPPNSTVSLTVKNTGSVSDTFNLSLAGPGGLVSTLSTNAVSLAAGKSQTVTISIGNPSFATLSSVPLQVIGASQANSAVTALANATIVVPSSLGVTAAFVPASQSNPGVGAGPVVFALNVQNTGSSQDAYSATITGTTGTVQASILGPNGSPTQSVPQFFIPSVTTGELFVNLTPAGIQGGTATVQIVSITNSSITATATATLTPGTVAGGTPCDVNNDAVTNVLDAQQEINEALGTAKPANDLNSDGVVNVVDVQIDINAILDLGCSASSPRGAGGSSVPITAMAQRSGSRSTLGGSTGGRAHLIVDLGTLGGPAARARGIDNLGRIVGESATGQSETGNPVLHAFIWREGRMTDLALLLDPTALDSAAYGINDLGQSAGAYSLPGARTASFLFTGEAATELQNLSQGQAKAINQAGQVVGDFRVGSQTHAFLWSAGSAIDLGTLGGGDGSHASAVNDSGQVVGYANLSGNSAEHAFLYAGSGLSDLGTLGGTNSAALGMNATGEIVGVSQMAGDAERHAFLYIGGWMSDLGTLGGADSQANGINSSGGVVGWATISNGQRHAFVWSASRMVDLNTLGLIAQDTILEEAVAINDFGQVVVNASNGHAYRIDLRGLLP